VRQAGSYTYGLLILTYVLSLVAQWPEAIAPYFAYPEIVDVKRFADCPFNQQPVQSAARSISRQNRQQDVGECSIRW